MLIDRLFRNGTVCIIWERASLYAARQVSEDSSLLLWANFNKATLLDAPVIDGGNNMNEHG
jgi:hypothetical protein